MPTLRWPALDANLPLAPGYLAAAARAVPGWEVEVLPWHQADLLGGEALLDAVTARRPDLVGLSLYLWNAEESLALGRRLADRGVPVLLGGPEVAPDNPWLAASGSFAASIRGEGEVAFARALLRPPAPGDVLEAPLPDLAAVPSPYRTGVLGPGPDGAVWLETLRGCPFRCDYCNYGKRRAGVRRFPPEWLDEHLHWAAGAGAREVYLMDPSFNVRRDWEGVLRTLEAGGRGLGLHAELVAEALRPGDADRLARAGLGSCEVGLQSVHPDVLASVGRRWDRRRWVRGVRSLLDAGVEVVVGLILGLPGDDPARFAESLEFVLTEAPGAQVQAFPLSLLPGTALRERAGGLGLDAFDRPPYTVLRTPGYAPEDFATAFDAVEEATGHELDPVGPPSLSGPWTGGEAGPYLSGVRLDAARAPSGWVDRLAPRAARHVTVWVRGWDDAVPRDLGRLGARLPHGVLTVVLEDRPGWPPERLRQVLAAAGTGEQYLDRHVSHLYGAGSRVVPRLAVLVEADREPSPGWLAAVRTHADLVWRVRSGSGWGARASAAAREGETAFVDGPVPAGPLARLASRIGADAPGVVFSELGDQMAWERATGTAGLRAPEHRIEVP